MSTMYFITPTDIVLIYNYWLFDEDDFIVASSVFLGSRRICLCILLVLLFVSACCCCSRWCNRKSTDTIFLLVPSIAFCCFHDRTYPYSLIPPLTARSPSLFDLFPTHPNHSWDARIVRPASARRRTPRILLRIQQVAHEITYTRNMHDTYVLKSNK